MGLIKYNSLLPSKGNGNIFDDFFNNSISGVFGSDFAVNHPSVNIIETDKGFRLEIAAPGLQKSDFDINIDKDNLNVSAKKEENKEVTNGKYTRREFNYASFNRSFQIPEFLDTNEVSASYENGVLTIFLPKNEENKVKEVQVIDIT